MTAAADTGPADDHHRSLSTPYPDVRVSALQGQLVRSDFLFARANLDAAGALVADLEEGTSPYLNFERSDDDGLATETRYLGKVLERWPGRP